MRGEAVRVMQNIASQTERPQSAWWLSFAAEDGFRGAVVVHAHDFMEALAQCNLRGINPHGECQGFQLPADAAALMDEKWKNRVLTRRECEQCDEEMEGRLALVGNS